MTKTQRRRTARAARDAAQRADRFAKPLDYLAAAKWLQDHNRWKRLEDELKYLIVIEFTSPFIDTELNCPEGAHLVVHLEGLREPPTTPTPSSRTQPPPTPDLQQRVARALDALATLCVTAQLLRPWDDLYQGFWARVIESDVMMIPIQAPTVDKWVRFTMGRGIPLLLSWSDTAFLPSQLIKPVQTFLSTPRPCHGKNASLHITIGLRFIQATLTTSVMQALHALLRAPCEQADRLLVDPTCLRTLWFDSNPFYAPELGVLAEMLSDPLSRRVDELKLEKFIARDAPAIVHPAFLDAFSRVFTNVCTFKTTDFPSEVPGLSLSLAENLLDAEHLDALRGALLAAERPVRALSLANIAFRTREANERLIELIFVPLPMLTPSATLNLTSGIDWTSLDPLVRRYIESFWAAGDVRDQLIQCLLGKAVLSESPNNVDPLTVPVPMHSYFTVEDYHPSLASIKLTIPAQEGSEPITGWVTTSSITGLRRNGVDVVLTSFSRLRFDNRNSRGRFGSPTFVALASAMGSRLTSLSLNHHLPVWYTLPAVLAACSQLRELSLANWKFGDLDPSVFWHESDTTRRSSIQILNLNYCHLRDTNLQALERLPLRSLQLLGNPVGAIGVESLLALLRSNKELKFVELNRQYSDPVSSCVSLRTQIDTLLDREYLQPRDKAAVLSGLAHFRHTCPRFVFPGNDVVALVFAFVGTKPLREVKWYY